MVFESGRKEGPSVPNPTPEVKPLTPKEKAHLAAKNLLDPFNAVTILGTAAIAIGSGGPFAKCSAIALLENTNLSARDIVEKSMKIAGDVCIYTNGNVSYEELA